MKKIENQTQAIELLEKLSKRPIHSKDVKVAIVRNRNNQMVAVWYYFDPKVEKQYFLDEYGTYEVHESEIYDNSVQLLISLLSERKIEVVMEDGPKVTVERRNEDYYMSSLPFSKWTGH